MYAVAKATGGDVKLLHQTTLQMNDPNLEKITWENRRPGDLLYFGGPTDYHHVSIYSGEKDGKDIFLVEVDLTKFQLSKIKESNSVFFKSLIQRGFLTEDGDKVSFSKSKEVALKRGMTEQTK